MKNRNSFGQFLSGHIVSIETGQKISMAKMGKRRPPFSKEWLKNMSKAQIGHKRSVGEKHPLWGKHHSEETKRKIGIANSRPNLKLRGEKSHLWKGGITPIKKRLCTNFLWKEWRNSIFKRDNWTCQECKITNCYLEAHHIIPVHYFMNKIKNIFGIENLYEKLLKHKLLFSLKNGITLCRPCHKKTMGKEELFEKKYSQIVYQV